MAESAFGEHPLGVDLVASGQRTWAPDGLTVDLVCPACGFAAPVAGAPAEILPGLVEAARLAHRTAVLNRWQDRQFGTESRCAHA